MFINRIAFCSASLLTSALVFPPSSQVVLSADLATKDLPLAGLAALEVSEEMKDGQRIFTSKLTATLCEEFEPPAAPIALLMRLTDGSRLLLGTSARPFPIVAMSLKRPEKASSQSACTLTATWTAPTPALKITSDLAWGA